MDAAEAGHRLARHGRDAERGLLRMIEAMRAVDAAGAHLVGAEQYGVGAGGRPTGDAGQRHELEIGARRREDDPHVVRHAISGADPPAHRFQPVGIKCG
jgi:hypothetical protein